MGCEVFNNYRKFLENLPVETGAVAWYKAPQKCLVVLVHYAAMGLLQLNQVSYKQASLAK